MSFMIVKLTKEIAEAAKVLAAVAVQEGATSVRVTCYGRLKIHRHGQKPEVFSAEQLARTAEDSDG